MKIRLIGANRLTERQALALTQLLDTWCANAGHVPATIRRAREKLGLAIIAAEQRARDPRPVPASFAKAGAAAPRREGGR